MVNQKKLQTFDIINYSFIAVVCITMLYPLWHTIVASFMKESEYLSKKIILFTTEPTFTSYRKVFEDGTIFIHLRVTVFITIVGTISALLFTAFSAYGLSKRFYGTQFIMYLAVATMFLKAGLIPMYLNHKSLGLINNLLVYIFPQMFNIFNLIVMRTYFRRFPQELEESAKMDGCNPIAIFFRIVLPLSKPILAAIGLFYTVQFWNTYTQSVFFITEEAKKTVQEYLQRLYSDSTDIEDLVMSMEAGEAEFSAESLKLANVVIVLMPIIAVYPFLQKYFVKGMFIGSVKG